MIVQGLTHLIVVHCSWMYWIDWGTARGSLIERASMDGSSRSVVRRISTSTTKAASLSLDIATKTLYWIDNSLQQMESSGVDGSNHRVIVRSSTRFQNTFGMAVYKGVIYWTERVERRLYSTTSGNLWMSTTTDQPFEISIVSPSEQPLCE